MDAGGWGNGRKPGYGIDDAVTKFLGMTRKKIQEQRQTSKSLIQIAASKNVSEDTLVNTILANRKVVLQNIVTAGTLTQDQADQRLAFMRQQIKQNVEPTTVGPSANRGMFGFSATTSGDCSRGGGMI